MLEIQLYKALLGAGVKEDAAAAVVDSLEQDIRERMTDARKELATKADIADIRKELAEAKTEIIKWNLATVLTVIAVLMALSKAFGHN